MTMAATLWLSNKHELLPWLIRSTRVSQCVTYDLEHEYQHEHENEHEHDLELELDLGHEEEHEYANELEHYHGIQKFRKHCFTALLKVKNVFIGGRLSICMKN